MLLVYKKETTEAANFTATRLMKTIAVFGEVLPRYSDSAVYREILALQDKGLSLKPISRLRRHPGPLPNEALRLFSETLFLSDTGFFSRAKEHVKRFLSQPFRYTGTLLRQIFEGSLWPWGVFQSLKLFSDGLVLARTLEQEEISHVHVYHFRKTASVALVAGRLARVSFSVMVRGDDLDQNFRRLRAKMNEAEWITVPTKQLKEFLVKKADITSPEKVRVIPPGVDMAQFTPEREEKNLLQKPRVLAVGSLTTESGFDILIKAAKILELNNLDFEIVIAGDGEAKADLQTLTNTLRLNRYVRITGARRMEEILDLLRRAEVFVLPSRKDWEESTVIPPMGMLEAMASGMPVITTGTIPGLIDKETGRVVPVDNPEILANVISELLANHYLREKLGTAARERVAAHYNLKKNVDELYRLLLSSNQGDEKES